MTVPKLTCTPLSSVNESFYGYIESLKYKSFREAHTPFPIYVKIFVLHPHNLKFCTFPKYHILDLQEYGTHYEEEA